MRYVQFGICVLTLVLLAVKVVAEERRIGVIAPLTGPLSNVGESIKNMVLLAKESYDEDNRVKFFFEDDAFDPKHTVSALQKLIALNKVGGLILFGSGTTLAVSSLIERYQIPTIAIAMADNVVDDKKFIFRHYLSVEKQNLAIVREVQRKRYRRVGVAVGQQEALIQYKELFVKDSPAPIVFDEEIGPGETNLSTLAVRIKAANPSAVYLLLLPPQLSLLPRYLRQLNYKGDFFGPSQLQNESAVKAAAGSLEDAWFVAPDDSLGNEIASLYRKRFVETLVPDGFNAFDAAKLFMTVPIGEDVAQHFIKLKDFKGVFGVYGMGKRNTFKLPLVLKRIKNGRFDVLSSEPLN